MRSPKWPNRNEPIGRAMNAMPKVTNADSACAVAEPCGKNTGPMTSAAAVAYTQKSQNSIAARMKLAKMTREALLCPRPRAGAAERDEAMQRLRLAWLDPGASTH